MTDQVVTANEMRSLVNSTVRDLNNLAQQAYETSRETLAALAESYNSLALTKVNVAIGQAVTPTWNRAPGLPLVPTEPDYSSMLPTVAVVPGVTKPATVTIDAAPDALEIQNAPEGALEISGPSIPALGVLPSISTVVPAIDVAVLDASFSFEEPEYSAHVSAEVEAGIKRVLAGNMGIPQEYWRSLWDEVAGDLARLQAARLRSARNRGAASFWALPGETVLAASSAIQDAGAQAITQVRLEQAKQQAVFAREDFWQAVTQGIAYEQQWLTMHQQVAARALASAEQLVNLQVAVHNTNIARFNAALSREQIRGGLSNIDVERSLKAHSQALAAAAAQIESAKLDVAAYQARWDSYQIDSAARIQAFGENIRAWNGRTEADRGYEALKQQKVTSDIANFTAQLGRVEALSNATAQVLQARTGSATLQSANTVALSNWEMKQNEFALDVAKLTQTAQQAQAEIDVAQSQWTSGQGRELLHAIAQLTVGFAQSAVAASDVNLSSSVSAGGTFSESWSASRNEEKVW